MLINHDNEKMLNAIIYFSQNTNYCGETKVMKLLYFLDFYHFKEIGKSVTGLEYQAWKLGPYPKELGKKFLNNDQELYSYIQIETIGNFNKIEPIRKFNDIYFTKREMRLLRSISEEFRDHTSDAIVNETHLKNHPWDTTLKEKGKNAIIDYFLALDETSPPIEYIKENIEDRKEIERVFNG
jgi:uncharacterized phage-associated protein